MDTKGTKSSSRDYPQTDVKHPPEWEADLNPDHMAGQNVGELSGEREQGLATAYDVKPAHRALGDRFADDELKRIPILPNGQRLEEGATYLDLRDDQRREFTARGTQEASDEHWYVPKDEVPYSLWNRLIGVENPARIPERGEMERGG